MPGKLHQTHIGERGENGLTPNQESRILRTTLRERFDPDDEQMAAGLRTLMVKVIDESSDLSNGERRKGIIAVSEILKRYHEMDVMELVADNDKRSGAAITVEGDAHIQADIGPSEMADILQQFAPERVAGFLASGNGNGNGDANPGGSQDADASQEPDLPDA